MNERRSVSIPLDVDRKSVVDDEGGRGGTAVCRESVMKNVSVYGNMINAFESKKKFFV